MKIAYALLLGAIIACEASGQALDPAWDKQPCAHCHMLVSDPDSAAQLITSQGERLYFDDVGCMASYLADNAQRARHSWVHVGSQWLQASAAHYRAGAATPMGFGIVPAVSGALDWAAVTKAVAAQRTAGANR